MRFYSRVPAALYINAFTAVVYTFGYLTHRHRHLAGSFLSFCFVSAFALALITQLFTYWEFHPDGLYARRLWQKRIIPFDQIAAIKSESPSGKPAENWLKVFYEPTYFDTDQNAIDRGTLLLAPSHRTELLTALRHVAPQATFETL